MIIDRLSLGHQESREVSAKTIANVIVKRQDAVPGPDRSGMESCETTEVHHRRREGTITI
jgi:hypothetical protein